MRKFIEEFKKFALRGNMMDMAVGVLIGGAFSGVVTALTDNLIQPILKVVTGAERYTFENIMGFFSSFISSVINFFIMALVLFCLLKIVNRVMLLGRERKTTADPTTKKCPYCRTEIDIQAIRCPHCTSHLLEQEKI